MPSSPEGRPKANDMPYEILGGCLDDLSFWDGGPAQHLEDCASLPEARELLGAWHASNYAAWIVDKETGEIIPEGMPQSRRVIQVSQNAGEPIDLLEGLDDRLNGLLLTAEDGNNFVLSERSAKNVSGIVREWLRAKIATAMKAVNKPFDVMETIDPDYAESFERDPYATGKLRADGEPGDNASAPEVLEYPLAARIWKRESTQEWVLEIEGTINDTFFVSRHAEPLSTAPEDVASLPSLYAETDSDEVPRP